MTGTTHKIYVSSFFIAGIAVTILFALNGFQYYSTPIEERFFDASHSALKPSGTWGHGLGIIGTFMMIFGVAVYMVRKRIRSLFNFGYLKHWLEFHIFLCSVGPVLVLYHTAFKFGGIVIVSFWSMVAVVLSGVIGRFIYVQIPRRINGQEISVKELNEMDLEFNENLKNFSVDENIINKLTQVTSTDKYKHVKLKTSLAFILKDYFSLRLILKKLNKDLIISGINKRQRKTIMKTAKAKLILARRIGLLRTSQKLFKYWHIVHLPFAITMFVIMIIHVAVTIAFGYKWIF